MSTDDNELDLDLDLDLDVDEAQMGLPVLELADHDVPVGPQFSGLVHRSIERRLFSADVTRFGLLGPLEVFFQFLRAFFESLGLGRPPDDTHKDE